MPFQKDIATRIALRARYLCEICSKSIYLSGHGHSSSGLHTISIDRYYCQATDSSPKHEIMVLGEPILKASFKVYSLGREDDGYYLCIDCHQMVHRIALDESRLKIPGFRGPKANLSVLDSVSFFFYKRKRF